jgi:hypothetical protein
MIHFGRSLILFSVSFLLTQCDSQSGATIGNFAKIANLPLYYSVAGDGFGEGAIYKISSLGRGEMSTSELVASGLDFPSGIAMDSSGLLYVAEKLPSPDGKVKVIDPATGTVEVLLSELHNPVSVGVDSFNRLYVVQSDSKFIQKQNAKGEMEDFNTDEIDLPRDIFIGILDEVYVTGLTDGVIAKISQDGQREVVTQDLVNPFGIALNLSNEMYTIVNNSGAEDGQLLKIGEGGDTVVVVDSLINPIALAHNNANGFFIIEGDPANRIINYSEKTGQLTVIIETDVNPFGLVMSPF